MASPAKSLQELEQHFEECLTQMQLQQTANMNEIRSLLRASADQGSPMSNGRQGSTNNRNNNTNIYATLIFKVEFPRFDGKNVCGWLQM